MNNRFLLYIAFTLVLFMIWQQWKIEQAPVVNNTNINNTNITNKEESTLQDFPEEAIMDSNSGNSNNFLNARKHDHKLTWRKGEVHLHPIPPPHRYQCHRPMTIQKGAPCHRPVTIQKGT